MALTPRDALEVAASALRRRDLSASAVAGRLRAAGADSKTEREALDWLVSTGLVDDFRLAATVARAMAERGFGDAAIDARLEREEVDRGLREKAIAELEPEAQRGRELARQGARSSARSLVSLLARRGFGDEAIAAALLALDGQGGTEIP